MGLGIEEDFQNLHKLTWGRQAIIMLLDESVVRSDNFHQLANDLVYHARFDYRLVFPILLKPCQWDDSSFQHIPVYPLNKTPISEWSSAEAGWNQVFREIANVLNPYSSFYPESPRAVALRSIGKVSVGDDQTFVSGFLCNPYLLLTSTLLIDSKEKAKQASVTFTDAGGLSASFKLAPDSFFLMDFNRGISLIGVKENPYLSDYRNLRTIQSYNTLQIATKQLNRMDILDAANFESSRKLFVNRQVVLHGYDNVIIYSGPLIPESLGGPLLNEDYEVVAVSSMADRNQVENIKKNQRPPTLESIAPSYAVLYEELRTQAINSLNSITEIKKESNINASNSSSVTWQYNANNILVVGTGWSQLTAIESQTSDSIGRMLAREGYGLIGGGWQGVDHMIGRAYSEELASKSISEKDYFTQIVYDKSNYTGGTIVHIEESYWYDEAILRAKAVIMIGGLGGTYVTFKKARANHTPIIPLITTGGDARKAYLKLKDSFIERYGPNHQLSRLYESLNDTSLTTEQLTQIVASMLKIMLLSPQGPSLMPA